MGRTALMWGIVLAASLSTLAGAAAAEAGGGSGRDPAAMSVGEISACMRANVVDRGSLRDFDVISIDREGKSSGFTLKLFWRPEGGETRMVLQVLEPDAYKGTSYLVVSKPEADDSVQVYLPALQRVQPIAGSETSQPLWGTDFTLADIKQMQGVLQDGQTKRLADATLFDRKAFVLDTATSVEETGYSRMTSFVDQETCTLLKAELTADANGRRKVLEADLSSLLQVDRYWLLLTYRITDLRSGTKSVVKLSDVYLKEDLPPALFTSEGFYKPET